MVDWAENAVFGRCWAWVRVGAGGGRLRCQGREVLARAHFQAQVLQPVTGTVQLTYCTTFKPEMVRKVGMAVFWCSTQKNYTAATFGHVNAATVRILVSTAILEVCVV